MRARKSGCLSVHTDSTWRLAYGVALLELSQLKKKEVERAIEWEERRVCNANGSITFSSDCNDASQDVVFQLPICTTDFSKNSSATAEALDCSLSVSAVTLTELMVAHVLLRHPHDEQMNCFRLRAARWQRSF